MGSDALVPRKLPVTNVIYLVLGWSPLLRRVSSADVMKDCAGKARKSAGNSMRKRISEMTPSDKASFLEATKRAMLLEQGVPWEVIEPKIQADIDAAFDDARFARMDPDFRIDAAYARREFGDKKPSIVDYMLWTVKFITHCDEVEWQ